MIKSPAILQHGKIYLGRNHAEIIHAMAKMPGQGMPIKGAQGFVNDKGVFLNREDAAKEAFENGQIDAPAKRLFSEYLKGYYTGTVGADVATKEGEKV